MTEPCRTECSEIKGSPEQVTYEKIIFSDGIFFSIPIEKNGRVHKCENIQNAEFDLQEKDNSFFTEMSEHNGALNQEDRKKYRSAIQAIGFDVLWHLEDKLGFKEDREEMRRLIGYYLDNTFVHVRNEMNRQEARDLPIMTRLIGKQFTYLELLGFLYQFDGFYADAKRCFEFMEPEYADSPAAEDAWVKAYKDGDIPSEWGLLNSAIITLMEEKIEQQDVGEDGLKNIGGMWFDENWSEELKNYWKAVEKNRRKGDDTKPNYQSQTSPDVDLTKQEISDEDVRTKIFEFERDVLRSVVRKRFSSEKEMNEKLKNMNRYAGEKVIGTLYDKALQHQKKEEKDPSLQAEDPMNVGLLRFLDIGDLVSMHRWPIQIYRHLNHIESCRHKLMAHPNVYEQNSQKHTNHIVLHEIAVCKDYFEKLDRI